MLGTFSCTDKFDSYNTDVKHASSVPGESLFANAEKELTDFISNTNVNLNIYKLMAQYWTETTYIDEANYDLVTRNISTGIYSRLYLRVLKDLDESAKLINATEVATADEPIKQNKLAIIEMMNVYVYAHLVDVFGAVPYSEALNSSNVYPSYDNGQDIYTDLFTRLDNALAKMDDSADSFGSSDLLYGGDAAEWVKFGNALKVKLAITIADADNAKAKAAIESAYSKIFESNDDDCQLNYLSDSPNYNQLYADLIASGRHDFVPANTIVDAMTALNDPRMDAYFADKIGGVYVGGEYGYSNSYAQCSHIGTSINEPTFPGLLMSYVEECFYLAEAAERGYSVGKTAEEWYDEGIKASFDKWGVSGADAYLLQPSVAYTTAAGTWKEKIGNQSWIANYVRGDVAYNNWRRLDYPILNIPEELSASVSGLTPAEAYAQIPVRFTFPVNEQTLNKAQYDAAAALIGGDLVTTKIFWDKY